MKSSSKTLPWATGILRVLKLRLTDQAPFVQMALKHLGLIRDKVEVEQRVTWEDIIVESRKGEP